ADAAVTEEATAASEGRIVLQHQHKAFERRLVEAVLLFELLDEGGVEAASAAVLGLGVARLVAKFAAGAADPLRRRDVGALQLRDHLLNRPARRRLHDEEI